MKVYKTKNNYYYKIYNNGKKKRISETEYKKKFHKNYGGRKKKKFKGTKVNSSTFIKYNGYKVSNKYLNNQTNNVNMTEMNLREQFGLINRKKNKFKFGLKRNGRTNPYENNIENIEITYFELFNRKFIFIGETHVVRKYRANYENYENLLKLPIKLAEEKMKCVDIYIEDIIHNKPILGKNIKELINKNSRSLAKLRVNLHKRNKHLYYRLHMFDTRETTQVNRLPLSFYDILFRIRYNFDINNLLINFFNNDSLESIKNTLQKLLNTLKSNNNYSLSFEKLSLELNINRFTEYVFLVVSRIKKEYNKIPSYMKRDGMQPENLVNYLIYKELFMTDLYLFYRLIMNFSTEKRNVNKCENYSERSIILAGSSHTENIINLFSYLYEDELTEYYEMPYINIPEYNDILNNYFYN